jgi:hypothetical protein
VQKDLLASKLETGPDSDRPRATRPDLPLCEVARCQLCEVARAVPDLPLCIAKCQLCEVVKAVSDFTTQLCDTVRPRLDFTVARSQPTLVLVAGFKSFNNTKAGHLLKLVQA